VDHGVGLTMRVSRGARVNAGDPVIELRHRDGRGLDAARQLCAAAIAITDDAPPHRDKVLGEVR
jgi:pyrimidine-nucleoside phosphorylase/thymidine phosphorylase